MNVETDSVYTAVCTRLGVTQVSPARITVKEPVVPGDEGICMEAEVGCHFDCAMVKVDSVHQDPKSGEISLTVSPLEG